MTVRPCHHPGCRDTGGDRRLTQHGLCDQCLPRLPRLLEDLGVDYARLMALPTPKFGARLRVDGSIVGFGHPAEWASETMTRISDSLYGWWDNLAEDLRVAGPREPIRQAAKVRGALAFLRARAEQIAASDWCEDALTEWQGLHREVAGVLGLSKPADWLPSPCWGCDATGLYLDRHRADPVIRCPSCGWQLPERHWGLYERFVRESREREAHADTTNHTVVIHEAGMLQ